MTSIDIEFLRTLPKIIEQKKSEINRLRSMIGLKGARITGMPHSVSQDKIGEIMPAIVDAEEELHELEQKYNALYLKALEWLNNIEDLKASYCISLRYLDGYSWDEVAREISNAEGIAVTDSAARKYCRRYLQEYCE